MAGPLLVDANLTLLFVVGSTSRALIAKHKRLEKYTPLDFDLLTETIGSFSDIVLVPNVVTEVSNLSRWMAGPARRSIALKLRALVEQTTELPVTSRDAVGRSDFIHAGLTDAALLHLCEMGLGLTLLTADRPLADRAASLGCSVFDFEAFRAG